MRVNAVNQYFSEADAVTSPLLLSQLQPERAVTRTLISGITSNVFQFSRQWLANKLYHFSDYSLLKCKPRINTQAGNGNCNWTTISLAD